MLSSLNGFQSLTTVEAIIQFKDNAKLANYCSLTPALSNNFLGSYFVSGNYYNPTLQEIIDGDCGTP